MSASIQLVVAAFNQIASWAVFFAEQISNFEPNVEEAVCLLFAEIIGQQSDS